jgi:uncharacterized BrkB/YihY/UPF0761 family membrane protein
MVWLWLSFPVVLLGVAIALSCATSRVGRQQQVLEARIAVLRASRPQQARR